MSAAHSTSVVALRAAVGCGLADVESLLKAWPDLDAAQIDAAAPVLIDCTIDDAGDELDLESPPASRESTPDGSGGASAMPSLSRQSASALAPICGEWSGAPGALSSNLGRLIGRVRCFNGAVADLQLPQAAVQQQKQQGLWHWLHDSLLPLLRGFADGSLLLRDEDLPAVCAVAQRVVNAHAALLALDPPAATRSYGEQAVQVLAYVFTSEYLRREGVRIPWGAGSAGQFARIANRQVLWCYLAVRGVSHASQAPIQLDVIDAAAAAQHELVHLAQNVHQPVIEAMARELLQAAEENGLVLPFSLFHSQFIKPLFEQRPQGGSLITCSFSSGLRVLFESILSQLAVFEIHAAEAGVESDAPTLYSTVRDMREQLTSGKSSARQQLAQHKPRLGHFFADRAVKSLFDQDMNNCTAVVVDCWSGIGTHWWWPDGLLSFYRVVSGPMTDQNQVGRSDKDGTLLRQAPPDPGAEFIPLSQEAPQVEPLEPPAKRPRLFSRVDTSLFEQLLRQDVLRNVLGWLRGDTLNTKAVQGLQQIAHPFSNSCKLPRVDPQVVHSGLSEWLLDLCRPADLAEDVLLGDDVTEVLEENLEVLDAQPAEAGDKDPIDPAAVRLLFRLKRFLMDKQYQHILSLNAPELHGFTLDRLQAYHTRIKNFASANDVISSQGKYVTDAEYTYLLERMVAKGRGPRGYPFAEIAAEAGAHLGGRSQVQLSHIYSYMVRRYNERDPAALLRCLCPRTRESSGRWTDAQDAALAASVASTDDAGGMDWDAVAAHPALEGRNGGACRNRWITVVSRRDPDSAVAALAARKRPWTSEECAAVLAAGRAVGDAAVIAAWEQACMDCPILRARGPDPCRQKFYRLQRVEAVIEAGGGATGWTAEEDCALNAGLDGCDTWSALIPLLEKDKRLAVRGRACCQARWAELHPGKKMRAARTLWTEELDKLLKITRESWPHASWDDIVRSNPTLDCIGQNACWKRYNKLWGKWGDKQRQLLAEQADEAGPSGE